MELFSLEQQPLVAVAEHKDQVVETSELWEEVVHGFQAEQRSALHKPQIGKSVSWLPFHWGVTENRSLGSGVDLSLGSASHGIRCPCTSRMKPQNQTSGDLLSAKHLGSGKDPKLRHAAQPWPALNNALDLYCGRQGAAQEGPLSFE